MIFAVAFALLAAISVLSVLLGTEDPRGSADPGDDPRLWFALSRR